MNRQLRALCEAAIMVALAVLLDFIFKMIPILKMPNGGSISIAMVPIILNGYRNGVKYGIIGGLCYAIINFMIDGFFWHWGSIIFDYILAFGVLGMTGLLKNKIKSKRFYILGIILVCFLRYIFHGLSGVIFFSEYAADWFNSNQSSFAYGSVFLYSFIIYNGPYMLGSTIASIIVALPLHRLINKNN